MFSPCRALESRWAGNRGQGERPGEALAWSLLALHPPHPACPQSPPLALPLRVCWEGASLRKGQEAVLG